MKVQRLVSLSLAVVCCLFILAACGGGDDDDEPTATPVPAAPTAVPTPEASPSPVSTVDDLGTANGSPVAAEISAEVAPIEVTVILTDYRVSSFQKELVVGQTYTFTIQNNGATAHQFVIEPEGTINAPLTSNGATGALTGIEPGESATLTWTFNEAGNYQFACHETGHFEQGMVQTGIVVNP